MKLDRIQTALNYIQREIPEFSSCSEVFKVLDRISLWKPTFNGEKIQHVKSQGLELHVQVCQVWSDFLDFCR